jgi:hypothetical protein
MMSIVLTDHPNHQVGGFLSESIGQGETNLILIMV